MLALSARLRRSPNVAWAIAFAAFAVALVVRFLADHLLPPGFPYLTFFPAVVLTAFFAGLWPGIVCATLSGLAAWYWFIPPSGSFAVTGAVIVALVFYVCIVAVDIAVIEAMHVSNRKLAAERAKTLELAERQTKLLRDMGHRQQRQAVLQRELTHRMKNTLAMVQAVVNQSLRHATDPQEAAKVAAARIHAIGQSLETLTEASWQAADLASIVRNALQPHLDDPSRATITGPDVALGAMQSMGLALAVHELATNATKYGALSTGEGEVSIDWSTSGVGELSFEWRERGGPAVDKPSRRGFGSRLIKDIVPGYFEGSAQLDHEPCGLRYRLTGRIGDDEVQAVTAA